MINKIDRNTNIFQVLGPYPDIRASLLHRGWIENTDKER